MGIPIFAVMRRTSCRVSGTLTFNPTEDTKTIPVTILNDAAWEGPETYTVTLSGPSANATITDDTATGTITNEDYRVGDASFDDVSVREDAGPAVFTVTLDRAVEVGDTVTVDYATADGSALAGSDYTAVSGTLTFIAGEDTKTISVTILNDADWENTETFTVTLSAPSANATITDDTAVGTITMGLIALPAMSVLKCAPSK